MCTSIICTPPSFSSRAREFALDRKTVRNGLKQSWWEPYRHAVSAPTLPEAADPRLEAFVREWAADRPYDPRARVGMKGRAG
jgi:hypothetical protein